MDTIATLYELRQHLGFDPTDTVEDARLMAALQAATQTIERRTRRSFMPRLATIRHDVDLHDVTELLLRDDLLELVQLINGDGTDISLNDVLILPGGVLRLMNGQALTFLSTPAQAILVQAIWGHHTDYADAWLDSGDTVQNNPFSATETELSVSDADGTGSVQRFQVGQLLRIGSEYLRVTTVDTFTDTLTVKRGANGTTAFEHAASVQIEIYQPPSDVRDLCLRWTAWLYRSPDSMEKDMPKSLFNGLYSLRRIRVA